MTEQDEFHYMLLDRLRSDCDYYLGGGLRLGWEDMVDAQRVLWAHSVERQIEKMRELYAQLPEPPEWLSAEDIDRYERAMLSVRDGRRPSAPSEHFARAWAAAQRSVAAQDPAARDHARSFN